MGKAGLNQFGSFSPHAAKGSPSFRSAKPESSDSGFVLSEVEIAKSQLSGKGRYNQPDIRYEVSEAVAVAVRSTRA